MRVVLFNSSDCELASWPTLLDLVADIHSGHVSFEPGDRLQFEENTEEE